MDCQAHHVQTKMGAFSSKLCDCPVSSNVELSPLDHQLSDQDKFVTFAKRQPMCRDHTYSYHEHQKQNTCQADYCSNWT